MMVNYPKGIYEYTIKLPKGCKFKLKNLKKIYVTRDNKIKLNRPTMIIRQKNVRVLIDYSESKFEHSQLYH